MLTHTPLSCVNKWPNAYTDRSFSVLVEGARVKTLQIGLFLEHMVAVAFLFACI